MDTSNAAVASVSEKLHHFAEGLDAEERAVVDLLLAKAIVEDEVSGFNFNMIQPVGIGRPDFRVPDFRIQLNNLFCNDGTGDWCRETIGESDKLGRFL